MDGLISNFLKLLLLQRIYNAKLKFGDFGSSEASIKTEYISQEHRRIEYGKAETRGGSSGYYPPSWLADEKNRCH